MAVRNEELSKHSEALGAQVRERTRDIQTILDNVTFGFLVIDNNFIIREGCTKSCFSLFAKERIAGENLLDLLNVTAEKDRCELLMGLEQVYDDFLPEELSLGQMQTRFTVNGKELLIEGSIIRTEEAQEVEAILMTVSDVTTLEAARLESQNNQMLVGLLKQRDSFVNFLQDAHAQLSSARCAIESNDEATVRRAVHTLKGNSASYGLTTVAALIHEEEEAEHIDKKSIDRIENSLRSFLDTYSSILEISFDNLADTTIELSSNALSELKQIVNSVPTPLAQELNSWLQSVLRKPAAFLLGPVDLFVNRLADRLEKRVKFELIGGHTAVDPERLRPILQNLTHAIRNAIDHGIEMPSERQEKGDIGSLKLSISDMRDEWKITLQDDGRGINPDRLVNRAIEIGHLDSNSAHDLDLNSKLRLVFLDGLSTANDVSDISGRGVGMSALLAAVESLGGSINIKTTIGTGTSFEITVPQLEERRLSA